MKFVDIPDLELVSQIFPTNHDHKYSDAMKKKTYHHIEPSIDLSEMETANMVKILEHLQHRFLELIAERLEDKEKEVYKKAYFETRSGEVEFDRMREAEDIVMDVVERFGKLVVSGDQLTVQSIETALESRSFCIKC